MARRQNAGSLISVGYEGRAAGELIESLRALRVAVVADVRLNAISRKQGLSKNALREGLEQAGIGYIHLRALGNPPENRPGFRTGSAAARRRFRRRLSSTEGIAAVEQIARLAAEQTVAVLCFEALHDSCHRACVIDAVRQRQPQLVARQA